MSIIKNNKAGSKSGYAQTPVFKKVVAHCLPIELIITFVPFAMVLLSLLFAAFGAIDAAEFICYYLAFPLALTAPLFITLKQISTLKGSFPRKSNDSHRVILSVFFSTLLCFFLLICLFSLACSLYDMFPMNFRACAYMRDMYMSSPAAIIITYITVFMAYTLVSLMSTVAYFIGEGTKKKFKFTISCLIFVGMYVVLLVLFLLAYFTATFLDIKSLEYIQISNSIFNSSMLCSFVTFIFISVLSLPILYSVNFKALKRLQAPKTKK